MFFSLTTNIRNETPHKHVQCYLDVGYVLITLLASTVLVNMTMVGISSSHTIRQKSAIVSGNGPTLYLTFETIIHVMVLILAWAVYLQC